MSTKPSPHSMLQMEMQSIRPPETLLPPVFPTLQELIVEQEIQQRTPPTRQRLLDLFDGTLGDLAPLLEDFNLHPEKYGAAQTLLLEQLTSGSTSLEQLSKSDRSVLNLAVLDFNAPAPVKLAAPAKKPPAQEGSPYEDEEPEEPFDDFVETELPAHWWLR
jgi:hypothetical protein